MLDVQMYTRDGCLPLWHQQSIRWAKRGVQGSTNLMKGTCGIEGSKGAHRRSEPKRLATFAKCCCLLRRHPHHRSPVVRHLVRPSVVERLAWFSMDRDTSQSDTQCSANGLSVGYLARRHQHQPSSELSSPWTLLATKQACFQDLLFGQSKWSLHYSFCMSLY